VTRTHAPRQRILRPPRATQVLNRLRSLEGKQPAGTKKKRKKRKKKKNRQTIDQEAPIATAVKLELELEPELEPELAPEPELELASVTRAQLQHEPEPEREVSGVAALLARLGLAEYLPACLQHEMDLGAPCWCTECRPAAARPAPTTVFLCVYHGVREEESALDVTNFALSCCASERTPCM
jgi:hypothetical protein